MTLRQVFILGVTFLILGLGGNLAETWYFGWNMWPASMYEAYADIFTGILVIIGFMLLTRCIREMKIRR